MSSPVRVIALPDNGRADFNSAGFEASLGTFATLPIEIPQTLTVWAGKDGRPLCMWADDKRVRPDDFATIWAGVQEYNADLEHQGVAPEPLSEALIDATGDGEED